MKYIFYPDMQRIKSTKTFSDYLPSRILVPCRLLAIIAMALLPLISLVTSAMYSLSQALMMRYCSFLAKPSATVTCSTPSHTRKEREIGD